MDGSQNALVRDVLFRPGLHKQMPQRARGQVGLLRQK